ncbi:MAG: class B sortase [Lachnospira sp.]|nr:class B sortase [Lachnospira sp.]
MNDNQTDNNNNSRSGSSVLRRIILVIAIAVFCYSAFMLIKAFLEYKQGDDIYNNIQNQVLNTESSTSVTIEEEENIEVPFVYDHNQLLSINSEGVGYLYIPSIDLRLPIVQSTDNEFYLSHTFDKTYNKNGCLFEDYRITGGLSSTNVIIYGHNMRNGSMFGQLPKYESESFYMAEGHDSFFIYTGNKIMQYRIFSAYITDAVSDTYSFNFSTKGSLQEYAGNMKALSIYDTGVNIEDVSQVVTLSTCMSYIPGSDQRFIVQGTYIGEALLE